MSMPEAKINANFHTHTTFCDGQDSPEDMVLSAIEAGLSQLGFSGHADPGIHMDLPGYCAEIQRLKNKYKGVIDILLGVELDNMYDHQCAVQAEYIIGSTHYLDIASDKPLAIDLNKEQFSFICREYFGNDYIAMSKAYYELTACSFDRMQCDIIGHFDLITKFNDVLHCIDESCPAYVSSAEEAMQCLCEKDVLFEINTGAYVRGIKNELYPCTFLLKKLHEFGGRIIISSDAHHKGALVSGFDYAVEKAIACGFKYANVLKHDGLGKVVTEEILLHPMSGQ